MLKRYEKVFPGDIDLPKFFEYLEQNESCVDRKNMNGHVDADALVVKGDKVLLVYHIGLQRWLQPGGHVESADASLIDSAIREVREETGLDVERVEGTFSDIPLSLDVQIVPESKKKGEGEHIHYSCMFLLTLKDENQEIVNIDSGVEDVRWFSFKEAVEGDTGTALPKAIRKYKKLL